jgi:hypothetical protein
MVASIFRGEIEVDGGKCELKAGCDWVAKVGTNWVDKTRLIWPSSPAPAI